MIQLSCWSWAEKSFCSRGIMNQQCWHDLLVKVTSSDTAAEAVPRRASLLGCTDTACWSQAKRLAHVHGHNRSLTGLKFGLKSHNPELLEQLKRL